MLADNSTQVCAYLVSFCSRSSLQEGLYGEQPWKRHSASLQGRGQIYLPSSIIETTSLSRANVGQICWQPIVKIGFPKFRAPQL